MVDEQLLRAYSEAERLEAVCGGLLRIDYVGAREAAAFDEQPGFRVSIMIGFTVQPKSMADQIREEVGALRQQLDEMLVGIR